MNQNLKGTRILIIDDEEHILNYIQYALEREGCIVACSLNGEQAMELFSKSEFDMVLTDIAMPEKDGIDTIIELRRLNPRVAIVAMSGVSANDTLLRLATSFDADATIKKPFTTDELTEALITAKKKKFRPE